MLSSSNSATLVVHDLKNPLTIIKAALDYVIGSVRSDDAEVAEALADGRAAAERCLHLIAGILDAASLENGRLRTFPEPVALASFLRDAAGHARPALRASHIAMELDVPDDLSVRVDRELFLRVVENLIDNAIRHTPAGGRLRVTARGHDGGVELRFADSGDPVPEELRGRLFDKFASGRGHHGSCGLGLYFCRLAVEAQGGSIALTSEDGFPTIFQISLPRRV